jgi:transposase
MDTGLGTQRWVVETFAWSHNFRRLRTRYERDGDLHLAFMPLSCAVIWHRMLRSQNG